MSIRNKFVEAREAPLREKDNARVESILGKLVAGLPAQMQEEIEKAGKGSYAGSILVTVYPDRDAMTAKDVARLPSFRALHALCADPEVDVCVTLTETLSTEKGYEGKSFTFSISLDQPYSRSNHKPAAAADRKAPANAP